MRCRYSRAFIGRLLSDYERSQVDLFHQLAFVAKGVKRHQQLGTQELLRRDGVTAMDSE